MKFAGLIKQSLVDYPNRIAAVLFTYGCNLRCPFCHNGHLLIKPSPQTSKNILIDEEEILAFIEEREGFLDALVISGGEPLLERELFYFIEKARKYNILLKIDTNGTNPEMLKTLLDAGFLDYVAMDIKAPLDYKKYAKACGGLSSELFMNIKSSIKLLLEADICVEFRTTVVPALHSNEDILEIARTIKGAERYTLQQFNPENALNVKYRNLEPYSAEHLRKAADQCRLYVDSVEVVNI